MIFADAQLAAQSPALRVQSLRWVSPASVANLEASCEFGSRLDVEMVHSFREKYPDRPPGEVLSAAWNNDKRATISLHAGDRLIGCMFVEELTPYVSVVSALVDLESPFLLDALRIGIGQVFAARPQILKLQAIGQPGEKLMGVAQQLGGVVEGLFRHHGMQQGRPCDLVYVAILREDFGRDRRAN